MAYDINHALVKFKTLIEDAIRKSGSAGKNQMIRSSQPINLIHDAVKYELMMHGVVPEQIYPRLGQSKPELKLAGLLKQKDQDICVLPRKISKKKTSITWGPMAMLGKTDAYGPTLTERILAINVRSQMSSIKKNTDTLFERTYAEALNLHMKYPNIVLGEVYLIPVYEYDEEAARNRQVGFSSKMTDIKKYISFFSAINSNGAKVESYQYERCALLIVDFNRSTPKLYHTTKELCGDGLISEDAALNYEPLAFGSFARDIMAVYKQRFGPNLI